MNRSALMGPYQRLRISGFPAAITHGWPNTWHHFLSPIMNPFSCTHLLLKREREREGREGSLNQYKRFCTDFCNRLVAAICYRQEYGPQLPFQQQLGQLWWQWITVFALSTESCLTASRTVVHHVTSPSEMKYLCGVTRVNSLKSTFPSTALILRRFGSPASAY